MNMVSFCRRVPWSIYFKVRNDLLPIPPIVLLSLLNRFKRTPMIRPGGPVLSLTTHSRRIRTAHITLETIARGRVLPSRIILWLDDKELFHNLPATIRRLQERGLEVKLCNNYGPHTKYYPYVETEETFQTPLVICDDDQLYPRHWLERLEKGYSLHPDSVNCHWGRVISLETDGVAQYESWRQLASTKPSFLYFALAVSGVIYPPRLLEALKRAGSGFEGCCPFADDVWLHVQALRSGFRVRQLRANRRENWDIPGTQTVGLWTHNIRDGNNDRQIQATYTDADIERLRTETRFLQVKTDARWPAGACFPDVKRLGNPRLRS